MMSSLDRTDYVIGMVARWQPVHRGHAAVLRALCDHASRALIGIGSSNRHNVRNPFTLQERTDMVELVLANRKNYTLIPVPDLDDGPRWQEMILELFSACNFFVTENPYVASLLANDFKIVKPVELVQEDGKIALNGSLVRRAMALGEAWQDLAPAPVAEYITAHRLDERFRREFGLQTISLVNVI